MSGQSYGRYTLLDKLGHGGMSVVHKAFDPHLERHVAVKILHPHLAERADSRARFSREARAVARLRHPNIVEVFDYASPQSDDSFIVTEYVDGPTLRQLAEDHVLRHPEIAVMLMVPIVDALDRAHTAGIVHRDVKPENIMLRGDGSPVLLDFGIAQMIDMPTLTATGTMLGSPAHMAPEVIDGKEVGAPADIFSVGTTLYWLVCGALPFSGPNPSALFRRILESKFDPVLTRRPRAGRRLARVIESCLANDPTNRPSSTELRQELAAILTSVGMTDLKAEHKAFFDDPSRYQDELHQRLVPALCTLAKESIAGEKISSALDSLDRVLDLSPGNKEALDLVNGIEKARRNQERLRLMALIACGLGPLLIGFWIYYSTDDSPSASQATSVTVTENIRETAVLRSSFSEENAASTETKAVLDADMSMDAPTTLDAYIRPSDLGTADATVLDSALPDARVKPKAKVSPPVAKTTSRRARSRSRRPNRRSSANITPKTPVTTETETTTTEQKPTYVRVRIGSSMKNAKVTVNDAKESQFLFQIEVAKGLLLKEGRNTIVFTHPNCEAATKVVNISRGQKAAQDVLYTCKPLPGRLRIITPPPNLEVRRDNGQLLGLSNQEISVPMPSLKARMALTVGTPGGRYCRRVVELTAGQNATALRLTEYDLKPKR